MAISRLYWIIICFVLTGCPIYDPPVETGMLEIINQSDSIWYVCLTCNHKLTIENRVFYQLSWGDQAYDQFGNKKDLFFPRNRIAPNDTSNFSGFGKPSKPRIYCEDRTLKVFFIKEEIMKTHSWEEICRDQKFSHKIDLTSKELDSINWKYVFNH